MSFNREKYTWFVADTEQTGPNTRWHSTHWFAAVKLTETLDVTFEGKMRPRNIRTLEDEARGEGPAGYHPNSMKYAGDITFDELLTWPDPALVMPQFVQWAFDNSTPGTRPYILTDNTGHDKKWLDIYVDEFYPYTESETPLCHSSQNLKDRFNGFKQGWEAATGHNVPEAYRSLEAMAFTKHNHTPLADAMGRAEALLKLRELGFPVLVH